MTPGTYLSARQVPVFVDIAPVTDCAVTELSIIYGNGGRRKACWWPNVPRCHIQAEQVFAWFIADCDNLGKPFQIVSEQRKEQFARHRRHATIPPEQKSAQD